MTGAEIRLIVGPELSVGSERSGGGDGGSNEGKAVARSENYGRQIGPALVLDVKDDEYRDTTVEKRNSMPPLQAPCCNRGGGGRGR